MPSEYTNLRDSVLHNGCVITRRRFLTAGAAARVAWPALAAASGSPAGLRLEYEVSSPPEVPPPLALESPTRLVVEIGSTAEGARCSLGVRVTLDGEPCLLPLAVWIGDLRTYWRYRETLRLPAFPGRVEWDGDRWSLDVAGRTAYSVRPAPPPEDPARDQPGLPWLTFRHAVHADWKQGPLDGPVELWMLAPSADPGSQRLPMDAVETTGSLDGWLTRLGASGPVSVSAVSGSEADTGKLAREMDASSFEPFSLRNYPGRSSGVGLADTSYLEPADLEAYRDRREIRLSGVMLVAVDASVARASVESLLPPPCVAPDTAVVRVMSVRGLDDPGLDEAWLFAQCVVEGKRFWYAVSHVRGALAGSEFGREVLGYPTMDGSVTATLGASQFSSTVSRAGSSLYHAAGFYGGFSTGTSLADMPVTALRLRQGVGGAQPAGELVTQPWYFQGLRKPVRRESLYASFPPAEGDTRPSVWNRMGPANAYWAMVFDSATMQRLPGTVVAEVENPGPYYRDRCDGHLPWESPGGGREQDPSD